MPKQHSKLALYRFADASLWRIHGCIVAASALVCMHLLGHEHILSCACQDKAECICTAQAQHSTASLDSRVQLLAQRLAASNPHLQPVVGAQPSPHGAASPAIEAHHGSQHFSPPVLRDLADALERYFYYVEAGISTKHIAPFRQAWIENVLSLLPPSRPAALPEEYYEQLLEEAVEEMKADYVYSMRKAVMSYVLRSPVERRCARVTQCQHCHGCDAACAQALQRTASVVPPTQVGGAIAWL